MTKLKQIYGSDEHTAHKLILADHLTSLIHNR